MKQYQNTAQGSQYNLQESAAPGFHVYQARVKVKNELYANSMDVAIFAKNPSMARQLLMAQYGKNSVITNVVQIA
jgi:patatin-like phospholipase/acyl hydrolase